MTTQITSWKNDVFPTVLCPEPSLIGAVRDAARDFCKETHLWTIDLDRISVVADTQEYSLSMPSAWSGSAEIVIIDNVKYKANGDDDDQFVTLDPIGENQKDLHDTGNWKYRETTRPEAFWADVVNKNLYLYQIPTVASASGVLVKVVAKPTLTATILPDFLYNDFRDCITNGALHHLYRQKNSKWYDLSLAKEYKYDFDMGLADAKWKKINGITKRKARANLDLRRGVWP